MKRKVLNFDYLSIFADDEDKTIKFCNTFSRSQLQVRPEYESDEHSPLQPIQPPVLIFWWHFLLRFLMPQFQLQYEISSMLIIWQLSLPPLLNEPKLLIWQLSQQLFMLRFLIFSKPLLSRFFMQQHQLRLEIFSLIILSRFFQHQVELQEQLFFQQPIFQLFLFRFRLQFLLFFWRLL